MKRLILPLALVLAACSEEPQPGPTPPPTPDTTPPVISDLAVSPEIAGRGTKVTATFKVDEELRDLLVRIGGRVAECEREALAASCSHVITGAEAAGEQTVQVLAIDVAGNQATASVAFTIDYDAPTLTFTAQPAPLTNQSSFEIAFASDDETATFTCQLDDGEEEACTSPVTLSNLSEGHHLFRVTARDENNNTRSIQAAFTVDLTPPTTHLVTGIPALTREKSHQVAFSTNDPTASFECRLDDDAWAPCLSPYELTGYAEGERVFEIRAVDEAGNADATPVQIAFLADWTAPSTLVDPLANDGARDVTISFSSNEPAARIECSIFGGPFAECSSPLVLTGLADGEYSVLIRAYDEVGNVEDPPAFVQFVVDRIPPQTTIFGSPDSPTMDTENFFEFSSNEAGSTFQCSLNGEPFADCTSPHTVNVLHGAHVFEVKATDPYGNEDPTPARYEWNVDTVAPVLAFDPPLPTVHLQSTLAVGFAADEEIATYECSLDGGAFYECSPPTVLTDLTEGTHVVTIRATDIAGNVSADLTGSFDIDLSIPGPGIPKLVTLSPSLTSNTTPTLAWEEASNADAYDVEISESPETEVTGEFVTPLKRWEDVLTLSQVTEPLTNGVYYYHVRAKNVTGPGAWSLMGRFEVDTWAQVSMIPARASYYGVACRSAEECVFVGEGGRVYRTMDGGRTLHQSSTPRNAYWKSIAWVGGDTLVASGGPTSGAGYLWRSHDFGASWFEIPTDSLGNPFPNMYSSKLYFLGETGIITAGSGMVYISTDAGVTWTPTPTKPATGTIYAGAVLATEPDLTLIVAETTRLHRSTDGGQTWTTQTISSVGSGVTFATAPDGTLFVGGSNRLYRSTDLGESFTEITPASGETITINCMQPFDANNLIVGGNGSGRQVRYGTIAQDGTISFVDAVRTDPGYSYVETSGGMWLWVDSNLNGFMVGVRHVFRVSGTPTALQLTTPAGASGANANTATTGTIIDFSFPSATVGFATAGSNGNFFKTENSGNTWQTIDLDTSVTNEYFRGIHFFDEDNGIGVGTRASASWAARTTDGGRTWTALEVPAGELGTLNGVAFAGPNVGFAVGDDRSGVSVSAFRWNPTEDKFDKVPVVDPLGSAILGVDLNAVAVFDANTAVVVGEDLIAEYDPVAGHFEVVFFDGSAEFNSVAFVDAQTAIAVGTSGRIYRRTLVGGVPQWDRITVSGVTSTLKQVSFFGQTGYIVGQSGKLVVTSDGGATWEVHDVPVTGDAIIATGPHTVFVGAGSRAIYRSEVPIQ